MQYCSSWSGTPSDSDEFIIRTNIDTLNRRLLRGGRYISQQVSSIFFFRRDAAVIIRLKLAEIVVNACINVVIVGAGDYQETIRRSTLTLINNLRDCPLANCDNGTTN